MKNLLIIGARGLGREVCRFAPTFIGYNETFVVKGFLDSDKNLLDEYNNYPPIISSVEDYEIQKDDVFICALGDPIAKKKYIELIQNKQGEFISLISKNAVIQPYNTIGKGCIILSFSTFAADVKVGDFVTLLAGVILGHDSVVEDYCVLDCYSFIGGYSHVKKGSLLSTGAKIMPHRTVGEYAVINAGSVVAKDVPDGEKVMGIPAQNSRSWLRMILQKQK